VNDLFTEKGEKRKMQKLKNKTMAIMIALILTVSIGASTALIPSASAHTPSWNIPTYAYIVAEPNPIGVGQQMVVYMWVNQIFGDSATETTDPATTSAAMITDNFRFSNYNFTVVAPDGSTNTTIFSVVHDPTSDQYTYFTPTQVGTYTLIFTFPGQNYNYTNPNSPVLTYNPKGDFVNDTYGPSSASTTLTVQQAPIATATGSSPLPTNYWTRPIYGENNYWYTISSNWLGTGSPVSSATGSGDISAFTFSAEDPWGSDMERYPGDAIGPLTGHIMWTNPLEIGGVVGGNNVFGDAGFSTPGLTYFEGSAYEQRYSNPIILNGNIYYTQPIGFTGVSSGATVCQNLQTGQIVWSTTQIPALSFAYVYNQWDPNQHGSIPPILFTANFARAFDAYTGVPLFNVTGVPSVNAQATAQGPAGEQLRYVISNNGNSTNPLYYLAEWNSSLLWDTVSVPLTGAAENQPTLYNDSTTSGAALNTTQAQYDQVAEPALGAVAGTSNQLPATTNYVVYANVVNSSSVLYDYDWNTTVPAFNTQSTAPVVLATIYGDVMLCRNSTYPASPQPFYTTSEAPYTYFAINLNATRGQIGSLLWSKTIQPPPGNTTVFYAGVDPTAPDGLGNVGVFAETWKETSQFIGYSLTTGAQIWGPTSPQVDFDYYGQPGPAQPDAQMAYGNLYSSSFGGILYCYSMTTGNLEWTYGNGGAGNSTFAGFNTPYGDYPTFINAVGNGVIYLVTTEHTSLNPIYKGALARAVNATNGAEIWTVSDYTSEFVSMSYAMADGYATWFNGYDDSIYVVGQGPSATTVQAPQTAITAGTKVVIQGTVVDTSAGTQQTEQKADFPNGVPCASDASMAAWMGYVYQQQPMPTNFTGVTVTLTAIDPNGNFIPVGTASTDSKGLYYYTWTPPTVPGSYLITATFSGTNGYWGSNAQTAMVVQNAPATPAPTATPASNLATMSALTIGIAAAVIAIIIAIAIVGLLLLRKKP
jgi:hypothetical protein